MKDRQIIRIVRYVALVFISISSIYLIFSSTEKKWLYILLGWIILVMAMAIYRYSIYRKTYGNFNNILRQKGGTMEEGNYFFAIPHSIKFIYSGKNCQIGYSIDPKLDHMIEYICPIDKEIELIIRRSSRFFKKENSLAKNTTLGKENFTKKFIVTGGDKDLIDIFLSEPEITRIIEELMQDFNYLCIGKDSQMRLLERYESYLTKPEKVFLIFDKMMRLTDFLEK